MALIHGLKFSRCCCGHLNRQYLLRNLSSQSSSQPQPDGDQFDLVIVGGGIVGAATARELSYRHPNLSLAIVEKENRLAAHQSGHNSGVIHAGNYYAPGSLKAKLCVEGSQLAYQYCDEHKIPYKKCGKLIVAVEPQEVPRLEEIYQKGVANGVRDIELIDGQAIKQFEPHCTGLKAIWSPWTGIVNWGQVNLSYGKDFEKNGGKIYYNFKVTRFEFNGSSKTPIAIYNDRHNKIRAKFCVTAAGLYSDKIAQLTQCDPLPRIVPFRGEYLLLRRDKRHLIRGNIYPVPDPRFPFLGVHFTPRMDGNVWCGPNAVLSLHREGYKFTDFDLKDAVDALSFRGLRKLAFKNLGTGLKELYNSFNISSQTDKLRKFVPELNPNDFIRGPSGVRAQALDAEGNLVDDFVFDMGQGRFQGHVIHVRNAPSPAATSSLAIAKYVANEVENSLKLK